MPFSSMVGNMLAINADVEGIVANAVITAQVGGVVVVYDDRFNKLLLIGMTSAVEYVAAEDVVHRMALTSEEERIDS